MSNVYTDFTNAVVTSLMTNISTMSAHNTTLQSWVESTRKLNQGWQTGVDPTIEAQINGLGSVAAINTYMNAGSGANFLPLSKWSSQLLIKLMTKLSSLTTSDNKDQAGILMGLINQYTSLLQSQSTKETATGDSQTKAQGNIIQQDTSAQQPIADAGSSAAGVLGAFASLLDRAF